MYRGALPIIRRVRYYSTVPISQLLAAPITHKSLQKIIPRFVELSITEQDSLIATIPQLINVQLQLLLHYEPLSKKIFKTICDYSKHVRYELVETYIYNLLQSNNLKAATLLLHKLFDENDNFQISNELWSYYMSIVCQKCDYLGAMMVFHELIDNVKFYDEITYLVQTNNLLPFLVNVTTLEQLAIIFKNNNDPVRIEGIIGYFRRFYSYHQSQYIYKSLLAARVECYASMNDLSQSLSSFVQYAHAHNESDKGRIGKAVPAVLENIRIRNKNTWDNEQVTTHSESKQNLDVHQNLLAEICNTELFNPIMHRNVYSSTMQYGRDSGMSTIHPVINGSISRNDLPNFEKLITKHIAKMDIREMLQLTVSRHALLHIFVVSGLCNLGKCKTALMYLRTLGPAFGARRPQHLIKNQNFVRILSATDDIEFAKDVCEFCRTIQNDHIDIEVTKAHVRMLLSNDKTTWDDLRPSMMRLERSRSDVLKLSTEQYARLQKITKNNYNFIRVHS